MADRALLPAVGHALRGRCPRCGVGPLFRGVYAVHPRCPHCDLPLNTRPGEFTGAAYLNTGLSGIIGAVAAVALLSLTDWPTTLSFGLTVAITLLAALALQRPLRALWAAMVWAGGGASR